MANLVKLTLYIYNGLTVLSRYLQMCHAYTAGDIEVFAPGQAGLNLVYWTHQFLTCSNHIPKEIEGNGVYAYTARDLAAPGQAGVYFVYFIPLPVTRHPSRRWCILSSPVTSQAQPPPPPPTVCSQLVKDHECYHCLCHLQLPMP